MSSRHSELRLISGHTLTVLAGQLASIAYGVTDTIVAGRHAETSLAALSIGTAVYLSVFVGLMGVLQALLPIWSELHGAQHEGKQPPERLGHSLRQSLYLWVVLSLAGITVLLSPGPLLDWAEVPLAMRGEVQRYLAVLAIALPVALLFRLFATLNQSLGHPQLVTWLQLGSLLVKIPLSIGFTFGIDIGPLKLPAQGAVGCAWATLVVQSTLLLIALVLLRTQALYRPYKLWQRVEAPHWKELAIFLRIGLPSGLSVLVEVTSFTLMALFIARMGTASAAAHQIAANLASVLYMMPLAIGIASSARTSYWLGAGKPAQARHAVGVGFQLVVGSALLLAGTVALLRDPIATLYTRSTDTMAQAAPLLLCVACYHLFDALQALAAFLLRCWRITITPLLIYGVLLWGLGLYGGYRLAYHGIDFSLVFPLRIAPLQTPVAFWLAGTGALTLTALAFWLLLWRVAIKSTRA